LETFPEIPTPKITHVFVPPDLKKEYLEEQKSGENL
jgi:hypothetical protein